VLVAQARASHDSPLKITGREKRVLTSRTYEGFVVEGEQQAQWDGVTLDLSEVGEKLGLTDLTFSLEQG
jgi:hypothetical protein